MREHCEDGGESGRQVKWFDVGASRVAGSVEVEGFGLALVFSAADPALLVAGPAARHQAVARAYPLPAIPEPQPARLC